MFTRKLFARRRPDTVQAYRLRPEAGQTQGRALLSFATMAYERLLAGDNIPQQHPAAWSNITLARSLLDLGFSVDVINWNQPVPRFSGTYDVLVDVGTNLEEAAARCRNTPVKIIYAMFSHTRLHNANLWQRHNNLLERRGVWIPPNRILPATRSVEMADTLLVPGGEYSFSAFAHVADRVRWIPQVHPPALDEMPERDIAGSKQHFLWMGGFGSILKGLDIVLEAFADMPDGHLHVCTDFTREPLVAEHYRKELGDLPNVHMHGWMDTRSEEWRQLSAQCIGLLAPSGSEVRATTVMTGMMRGLIPLTTFETDYSSEVFCEPIDEATPEGIKMAVLRLSSRDAAELSERSHQAYRWAREFAGCSINRQAIREGIASALGRDPLPENDKWLPSRIEFVGSAI